MTQKKGEIETSKAGQNMKKFLEGIFPSFLFKCLRGEIRKQKKYDEKVMTATFTLMGIP